MSNLPQFPDDKARSHPETSDEELRLRTSGIGQGRQDKPNSVFGFDPFLKNYAAPLILLMSILVGSLCGFILKDKAIIFKPFGDIFLNMLFTVVVPLVFFSMSSSIASMPDLRQLRKISGWMMGVFILTGVIAAVTMLCVVKILNPFEALQLILPVSYDASRISLGESIVNALTVADFAELFYKKNMLALLIFSVVLGICASIVGKPAKPFVDFLVAGNVVMSKVIKILMLYAPVGLGGYFAYLVGVFGPQLLGSYLNVVAVYYPVAIGYFICAFSLYVLLAGGLQAVKRFWRHIIPVALTSFATGSSLATIPSNLEAARRNGVREDIRDVVIPIGATIHMEGSCLSAIIKITLLFAIFGLDFSSPTQYLTAIAIAILSGTVMSGIPGGGFLGELLIVSMYGFPIEALPILSMVGTLVDPPATMVNAVGDNVSAILVNRIMDGKDWDKGHEDDS